MENTILGIHHITAIAGDAQRNFNFYSKILGLRFIKKTVNFDDPGTYHFYFGDEIGSAGTILTFFPWGEGIQQGRKGSGMATEIGYSVPKGSLDFWIKRFEEHNVIFSNPSEKFGEKYLTFTDPDGLKLELIESKTLDSRKTWETNEIKSEVALKGFHNITLTLNSIKATSAILTEIFSYRLLDKEANRFRYSTSSVENAAIVDLVELEFEKRGHVANGSVHHVAFRVKNDESLMYFREIISELGFGITPQIDRQYFHSLYFREPGGVLFEIATDNPGFTVDETLENLGKELKLPAQHESKRKEIEALLVKIN
ncbi:ring-cleaving dioxygenase [Flavobacterium aquatile]|uniref:Diguanylate cyclase n=1 Tax=Flavobacterium aquatile LMG 4008 = ATCC 11947 TaxID=1453498 RepID=A0A095U4Y0_9FLAO|nr:ring-cleaving dioxygenase [Flavobacterium aquatile]KGD69698.1 diguanylate cyclase [Flavobacterium aquatile LMG 4008 = ATCC 11947]OXA67168.1 ring-cleaving dioxygenase [Flavobacterium aquatile LMG 4008 = ATCC 11947]GEC77820.1 diguanylate cyclase [Flavobacterium aquatile]